MTQPSEQDMIEAEAIKELLHQPLFERGDHVLVYSVDYDGTEAIVKGFNQAGRMLVEYLEIQYDSEGGKFSGMIVHPKQCRLKFPRQKTKVE
jgi:hypothetical protein